MEKEFWTLLLKKTGVSFLMAYSSAALATNNFVNPVPALVIALGYFSVEAGRHYDMTQENKQLVVKKRKKKVFTFLI